MTRLLRALALQENQCVAPSTPIEQFTVACNYRARPSDTCFLYIHILMHTHMHINNSIFIKQETFEQETC